MPPYALILLIYALCVTTGGLIGYLNSGSVPSLLAGGGSGLLLLILTYPCFKKRKLAETAALILVFLLDAFFTYRFVKTLHFFPAGLFSIISTITIVLLAKFKK